MFILTNKKIHFVDYFEYVLRRNAHAALIINKKGDHKILEN